VDGGFILLLKGVGEKKKKRQWKDRREEEHREMVETVVGVYSASGVGAANTQRTGDGRSQERFGSSGNVIFSLVPVFRVYRSTGQANSPYGVILNDVDNETGIGFGGLTSKDCRIWIDKNIETRSFTTDGLKGTTTYEPGPLFDNPEAIKIVALEVWTLGDEDHKKVIHTRSSQRDIQLVKMGMLKPLPSQMRIISPEHSPDSSPTYSPKQKEEDLKEAAQQSAFSIRLSKINPDTVSQLHGHISSKLDLLASNTKNLIKDRKEQVNTTAQQYITTIQQTTTQGASQPSSQTSPGQPTDRIAPTPKSLGDKSVELISETTNQVSEAASKAVDLAKDSMINAVDSLKGLFDKMNFFTSEPKKEPNVLPPVTPRTDRDGNIDPNQPAVQQMKMTSNKKDYVMNIDTIPMTRDNVEKNVKDLDNPAMDKNTGSATARFSSTVVVLPKTSTLGQQDESKIPETPQSMASPIKPYFTLDLARTHAGVGGGMNSRDRAYPLTDRPAQSERNVEISPQLSSGKGDSGTTPLRKPGQFNNPNFKRAPEPTSYSEKVVRNL